MEFMNMLWGLMGLMVLVMCIGGHCLEVKNRILKDKSEYLEARMKDTRFILSARNPRIHRGKLRKQLRDWLLEVQELIKKVEMCLSGQNVGGWRSFLMSVRLWDVDKLIDDLEVHSRTGDELFRNAMSDTGGPSHGYFLPVKALVGQVPSNTLKQLNVLLLDETVGRIAIHGERGVGKTFLMKHLHNSALNCVEKIDYVFWITFPCPFAIKHVQDAIAAVLQCDLTGDDDLNIRARKLSDSLTGLGSVALFLDGVTEVDFSWDEVGIPVNAEWSKCKLILTTNSALERRLLNDFKAVKVDPLPEEEAYQLFMYEVNIGNETVPFHDGICSLLAESSGLPRKIVSIATRMCGIVDPHEWNHALFELGCNRLSFEVITHQLRCEADLVPFPGDPPHLLSDEINTEMNRVFVDSNKLDDRGLVQSRIE